MLSPLFWISFVIVTLGIKWVADGLLSVASVELRETRRPAGRNGKRTPVDGRDFEIEKAA